MATAQVMLKVTPGELQLLDAALRTYKALWTAVARQDAHLGDLGFTACAPGDDRTPDPRRLAMQAEELKQQIGLR